MKRYYSILLVCLVLLIAIGGCSKFDNKLVDPNYPAPGTADVDLYLNYVQLGFSDFYANTGLQTAEPGLSEDGEDLTRMETMASRTYLSAFNPASFDGLWRDAYQNVFKNANAMLPVALKTSRYLHTGMAKVLKAYTAASLVDFFGDVPYTEANKGIDETNPAPDPGKVVYDSAFALLDDAIADFNKVTSFTPLPANDLFYSGSALARAASWRRAAKTIKLKLLNQIRLVDNTAGAKISALLTDGELITTDAQAFLFRYSTKALNPNSRHPKYNSYYTDAGANDYIGNYFLYTVYVEKGLGLDPRWRYYFYRQIGNVTVLPVSTLECLTSPPPPHYPPGTPFCYANISGFYGRDHGNDRGIPPDGFQRTIWGIYPAGGKFDNDERAKISGSSDGAQGQGYLPIWQPAFTDFVKAESALKSGTTGDPRALLQSAVKKSIATVVAFPASIGVVIPTNRVPTAAAIQSYVDKVSSLYDGATDDNSRLNVIMKEYYIALWGNAIESYN